jgi:tight adherence protein C
MELLLASLLFIAVATTTFAFGAARWAPASVLGVRLRSLTGAPRPAPARAVVRERLEQALEPLSKAMPKSPEEVSRTRARLMQAGYREDRHATLYYGLRTLFAAAAFALVVLLTRSLLYALVAAVVGYMLPRFLLARRIRRRQLAIRLALPDALDLAVICVEAGLGLDQAITRIGDDLRHVHPELSEELGLVNLEMRAGKARVEALRNLAARTAVDDLRSLVAVLVQTDRFGTSIASALRVHSDALRTERRQRAEEQAAKTTIKMVPVLVLFIFPSMFIVSLGPAAIQLIRNLLPVIMK